MAPRLDAKKEAWMLRRLRCAMVGLLGMGLLGVVVARYHLGSHGFGCQSEAFLKYFFDIIRWFLRPLGTLKMVGVVI